MLLLISTLLSFCAFSAQAFHLLNIEEEFRGHHGPIFKKCLAKYRPELVELKNKVVEELKACKSAEQPKECAHTAVQHAKVAGLDIAQKIRECVKEGSAFELVNEEITSLAGSAQQQCLEKYKNELTQIKETLVAELKACKSGENPTSCSQAAIQKARTLTAEVADKIRKCIVEGVTPELALAEVDQIFNVPVHKKCLEKYLPEFQQVKEQLAAELKSCKTAEDPKACGEAAAKKAKTAVSELREKVRECIKTGLETESLFSAVSSNMNGSVAIECAKKYAPELAAIRDQLVSDMKNCKVEPQCIAQALTKAKDAVAAVAEKVRKCIEAGGK